MENQVADTAAAVMDKWADKLGDAINQYGPQASELALQMGRLAAVKEIVLSLAGVIGGALILIFITRRCVNLFRAEMKNPTGHKWSTGQTDMKENIAFPCVIIGGGSGILGSIFIFANAADLLNPFVWVGLYRPEVYLAAKALGL